MSTSTDQLSLPLLGVGVLTRDEASAPKGPSQGELARRRAEHLYPLLIKALDNDTRRRILAFLFEEKELAFSEIQSHLSAAEGKQIRNASLSRHLGILHKGRLVQRATRIGPRTEENPYYSFYTLSLFGRTLIQKMGNAILESVQSSPGNEDVTADKQS